MQALTLILDVRFPHGVCTENLNPDVVVMKSAEDRVDMKLPTCWMARWIGASLLRDRCVLNLTGFLYQRDRETIALGRPDLAVA